MKDYNAERRFIRARLDRLVGHLPNRRNTIKGVFLHTTRSGRCGNPVECEGTENWMFHPSNKGSAYDGLVCGSGQQIKAMRWEEDEQPLWAGGYGDEGTWNAQQFYVHLEIAQACIDDPFTDEQVESTAQWTAELAKRYFFDISRIAFLSQTGVPPEGVCDHQHSANGAKLGKSDPGPLWPWEKFIKRARVLAGQDEDEDMLESERKLMLKMATVLAGESSGRDFASVDEALAVMESLAGDDAIVMLGLGETQRVLLGHSHDKKSGDVVLPPSAALDV